MSGSDSAPDWGLAAAGATSHTQRHAGACPAPPGVLNRASPDALQLSESMAYGEKNVKYLKTDPAGRISSECHLLSNKTELVRETRETVWREEKRQTVV